MSPRERIVVLALATAGGPACARLPDLPGTYRSSPKADDPASISPWEPGDDVPGWDDYDCPDPVGSAYMEVSMPTALAASCTIATLEPETVTNTYIRVIVGDCETAPCDDGDVDPQYAPQAYGSTATNLPGVEGRAQGLYTLTDAGTLAPYAMTTSNGQQEWGTWLQDPDPDPYNNADVAICISRFRPDEIRGTFIVGHVHGSYATSGVYDRDLFELRVRFDALLVEHGGWYGGGEMDGYEPPEGASLSKITYGDIDYADAWPWDDITDPDIREELYQRYTPWNVR